jgi:hypothetical protein
MPVNDLEMLDSGLRGFWPVLDGHLGHARHADRTFYRLRRSSPIFRVTIGSPCSQPSKSGSTVLSPRSAGPDSKGVDSAARNATPKPPSQLPMDEKMTCCRNSYAYNAQGLKERLPKQPPFRPDIDG